MMPSPFLARAILLVLAALVGELCFAQEDADVMPAPPPKGAMVLFDGKDLADWSSGRWRAARWIVRDGYAEVNGKGSIQTREKFRDFQLHLEFWLPLMADAKGQGRANSGVYLQGRYEIQVFDSYGQQPEKNSCGAIYGVAAPLRNASRKPRRWQSFDIVFRAPRVDGAGKVIEPGRVTVLHNGVVIHHAADLWAPTGGALDTDLGAPGAILLQDHGSPVRYRNIWILPIE